MSDTPLACTARQLHNRCSQVSKRLLRRSCAAFDLHSVPKSLQLFIRRALRTGVEQEVLHLDGGVFRWSQAGLPFDGEYDASNVGRTPNAASDARYPGINDDKK